MSITYVDTTNGRKDGIDTITAEAGAGNTIRIVVDTDEDTWGEARESISKITAQKTQRYFFSSTPPTTSFSTEPTSMTTDSLLVVFPSSSWNSRYGRRPSNGLSDNGYRSPCSVRLFCKPAARPRTTPTIQVVGGESFTELGAVNINIAALGIGFDSAHDKTQHSKLCCRVESSLTK